ncbi:MAG: DsbA family protein [Aquincola tertiaricarbonis]
MTSHQLHYIYDPLCGWCYGAAPLVAAARQVLPVRLHGGGLMAGAQRQVVSARLREYVMPHDRRIAQLTGQPFGDAYFDGLLHYGGAVLDSEPPITAVLAAEQLAGRSADLLARVQAAHYQQGRRIAEPAVLRALAADIGLDEAAFSQAFDALSGEATRAHIADSRQRLAQAGGGGFPTMLLETDGRLERVDVSAWLGRPEALAAWLMSRVPSPTTPVAQAPDDRFGCGPQACTI